MLYPLLKESGMQIGDVLVSLNGWKCLHPVSQTKNNNTNKKKRHRKRKRKTDVLTVMVVVVVVVLGPGRGGELQVGGVSPTVDGSVATHRAKP